MSKKLMQWLLPLVVVAFAGCGGAGSPKGYRPPATTPPPAVAPTPPILPVPTVTASKDADEAYLAGRYDEAYRLYEQRVLVNGYDFDAHDGLIRSAVKLGKVKEAVKWYRDKLNTFDAHPGWCYGGARALLQDGDREQCSTLCLHALRINRGIGRLYFLLGIVYYTQAVPEYKTAVNSFNKAIQYDPKYGPSYYHLAKLEAGVEGNREQAKALISRGLLNLKPVESDVRFLSHVLLGGLLVGEKSYSDAVKQFETARQIGGDAVYEHVDFGRLYELMGKREEALKEWKSVEEHFGLASPTGLLAYRSARRLLSKVALDLSNFLPGGTERDYQVLVSHLLRPREVEPVRVPATVAKLLNEIKTPVRFAETDLDGDGKVELVVVEVRQRWDSDVKGYFLADSVVYVFTPKGGTLGFYDTGFDHFWDIALVDFNGDGRKEIVCAAFNNPNVFNVIVMTRSDRRYRNTFGQTVECVTGACGALVDDLDGDGKLEIMTVSGGDLWVQVWRWSEDGTFTDASVEFPDFYRAYVKKYGELKPAELERYPEVRRHLEAARRMAVGPVKGPDTEGKTQ